MVCKVGFSGASHVSVTLPAQANLAENLTIVNSPVLFGCRTGICGTCLVQIDEGYETLIPPGDSEREALECYAPGNPKARLACQIDLSCDIVLKKIECA